MGPKKWPAHLQAIDSFGVPTGICPYPHFARNCFLPRAEEPKIELAILEVSATAEIFPPLIEVHLQLVRLQRKVCLGDWYYDVKIGH